MTSPLELIRAVAARMRRSGKGAIDPQTTGGRDGRAPARDTAALEAQLAERDRRLATLTERSERLERALAAKNRLLAAASHDLRQPLQAATLFCHALERRVTAPEAARIVSNLGQSLASLNGMLDATLHIARIDAGLVARPLVPVKIRAMIDRIGGEFSAVADARGLRFNFTSVDCDVSSDTVLLETIIRNLVSNAFKFTRTGGVILAARSRGAKVVIEVYDTGPGIEPDRLETIFDEFEKSRDQANGPNDGLGLGLSIAERHARLIDAQIVVHSVAGRGSRFSIIVPRASAMSAVVPIRAAAPGEHSLARIRVMLIDGNAQFLKALSLDLVDRGATITSFGCPVQALAAVNDGLVIDVAIVDFALQSAMTGIDVFKRCRAEGRDIVCIILTGRTDIATLSAISSSGLPWMTKPADPNELAALICRMSHPNAIVDDVA